MPVNVTSCEKIQFQQIYMYTTKTGTPMKTGLSTIALYALHGVTRINAIAMDDCHKKEMHDLLLESNKASYV